MKFEKGDRVCLRKMQGRSGVVTGFMEHPDGRILTVQCWGGVVVFWRESDCIPYQDPYKGGQQRVS